ncbi:hypothetical protein M409DRAFT_50706 [Zasmidium cellare ATCC 36951]|uniref:Uncharacterized protein n=1 Tax=Zasmidium cellare ATCC 36951 TaxID=1080233 RepID=A0A6A6CYG7_ZASCE|nr:uncharacterized protein M409DRAFT_50706 [Zasmidium cellare ATCC 36951]KAF2171240.1 hypothetical protein M409DRAFT_50706 [Zasmidium cellare ATCC 36951]
MSRRSAVYPYPVDRDDRSRDDDRYHRRSQRPRGDSYRRPPPPPEPSRMDPSPRRRRPSTTTTTTSTPSQGPPPRKSVRFTDGERPSTRRPSSGSQQPMRPKTFAKDSPPAAISESAKDTSRRLFHRRPSDGGRPSARPAMVQTGDSNWTVQTTRAEMGTTVGGGGGSRRGERESWEHRERERYGGRSRRR